MGPMFTDFLCKIHQIGRHIPVYLTYKKPPPPSALNYCRGIQIILISSIFGMHRIVMRILQQTIKKCWKEAPFKRVMVAGTLE